MARNHRHGSVSVYALTLVFSGLVACCGTTVGVWGLVQHRQRVTLAYASTPEQTYLACVSIIQGRHGGTGTVGIVKGRLLVLTANHVVDEGDYADVCLCETETILARCKKVYADKDLDLAVLDWPDGVIPHFAVPDFTPAEDVKLGEKVWYTGTPVDCPLYLEFSHVAKVNVKDFNEHPGRFMVTGSGWYGSSGSSIWVERDGKAVLAGVLIQGSNRNPKSPAWCVSPGQLRDFWSKLP